MRTHASLLALALFLLPAAPVGSGGVADGDGTPAAISISSPSAAWARRVEWGIERFAIAGLPLPPMTVSVHGDTAACNGNAGLYRPRDPVEIHLCTPSPVASRAARLITLHEFAHAWAETKLTRDQREGFLRLRGLASWTDHRLPRHEWGAEHAAEVVSWGLMDEPVPIIRIYDAEPPELATAFDLLVGRAPLWDGHAGRVADSACRRHVDGDDRRRVHRRQRLSPSAPPSRHVGDILEEMGGDGAERALELADEAFARGDIEALVAHLSAAIRGFTAADERCQAAMVCLRLGDVLAHAMGNLTASRAWFARARRLVEDLPPCLEQGWVAVAAMGCDVDDPAELLASAELALDRARRFGDVNLETKALADAGLAHVQAGRVLEGMALLDEAMALACGPADDAYTAGKSVCSFFTACYFAADFERAGSWTGLLRSNGLISLAPGAPVFLSGHCDSVHATLLVELGRWTEAEALLTRAKADFEATMHTPSWHPDIALADLRIRQSRLADAEALLLGKDQAVQALLPTARLHLARGDIALARAAARRGLRVIGEDRLRAVELLTVLVEAELAAGDVAAAAEACRALTARTRDLDVPPLQARTSAAHARTLAATGALDEAIATLEVAVDRLDPRDLPWLRVTLLIDLARLRERAADTATAAIDAKAAAAMLRGLDVVLAPADVALLERLAPAGPTRRSPPRSAVLGRDGKWWVASSGGSSVLLQDSKGLHYLAELVARPGAERHVLDLVDRVEGVASGGPSRRALGDAGEVLDTRARTAYRHRIEQLRGEADDALAAGLLETAEAKQAELDQLVAQLAQAFGLGGRDRRAASAAERARLNVTRALRAAIARLHDALPDAGEVLDRRVRTGVYCVYAPAEGDDLRWIVQS